MYTENPTLRNTEPITNHATEVSGILNCGQDLCIGSDLPAFITFSCEVGNSDRESEGRYLYKDNTIYSNAVMLNFVLAYRKMLMIPDSLGTYKTVLNDSCGMDIVTSILSLCGKSIYTCIMAN